MRPLVTVLVFFLLLALAACQSGPGLSGALEVRPALGAGVRGFAGPQDGVGVDARLDLGRYGCRAGRAAEPGPSPAPEAPCAEGACRPLTPDPVRAPESPTLDAPTQPGGGRSDGRPGCAMCATWKR